MRRFGLHVIVALFSAFVALAGAGGWYVWSTLKSVETALPLTTLEQHRGLSGLMQSLSRVATALDAVRVEPTAGRLDEFTLSLDLAYATARAFREAHPAGIPDELQATNSEVERILSTLDQLLADAPTVDEGTALQISISLSYTITSLRDNYLQANQRAVIILSQQVAQIKRLRVSTMAVLALIALSLAATSALILWQWRTIAKLVDAEEALHEKEAQLRLALDNMPGGMRLLDKDRKNVLFNSQYLELYDFPDGLLKVGESNRTQNLYQAQRGDFGPGDPGALTDERLAALPVQTEPVSWEDTPVGGKILQVDTSPTPEGGYVSIVTDITERKRVEEELKENRKILQVLADNLPGVVYQRTLHPDGSVTYPYISSGLDDLLGKCPDENVTDAERLVSSMHPDDRDKSEQANVESARSLQLYDMEYRGSTVSGEIKWLRAISRPSRRENGDIVWDGIVLDIDRGKQAEKELKKARDELERRVEERTAELSKTNVSLEQEIAGHKQAEETLRKSEERFKDFAESASDWFWEMGPDLRFTYFSGRFGEILGVDPETYIGKKRGEVADPKEDSGKWEKHLDDLKNHRPFRSFEYKIRRPDGTSVDIEISGSPIILEGGEFGGYRGVGQDIGERKKQQVQLIQTSKLATLGEMATGVAHELNQPLNVIRMAADSTLERVEDGEFDTDYLLGKLERISAQTERAAAIIDHMRIFGRKSDEKPRPIDPREAIENALGLMGEQLRLREIEVETVLPEHCRNVSGHAVQLEQVLLNLIGNARDAIETNRQAPGEPRKISFTVEDTGSENTVKLIVKDSGGGIPEDIIPRIFEPFYTTKEMGKGTGLGLSISYGIISDMSGVIEAANIEDGARITITLPTLEEQRPTV